MNAFTSYLVAGLRWVCFATDPADAKTRPSLRSGVLALECLMSVVALCPTLS